MTAQIAKMIKEWILLAWVKSLISELIVLLNGEQTLFAGAALWMDGIKKRRTSFFFHWQYTDKPIKSRWILDVLSNDFLDSQQKLIIKEETLIRSFIQYYDYQEQSYSIQDINVYSFTLYYRRHELTLYDSTFWNNTLLNRDARDIIIKWKSYEFTFILRCCCFHFDYQYYVYAKIKNILINGQTIKFKNSLSKNIPISSFIIIRYREAQQFVYPMLSKSNIFDSDDEKQVIWWRELTAKLVEIQDQVLQKEYKLLQKE